ncbi:hypothetical protein LCGC14_2753960, partial [marine sediment metagenome]
MRLTHANRSTRADILREVEKKLTKKGYESDYLGLR